MEEYSARKYRPVTRSFHLKSKFGFLATSVVLSRRSKTTHYCSFMTFILEQNRRLTFSSATRTI
jgi:hypothetical protein